MGHQLVRLLSALCLVTLVLSQVDDNAYQKLRVFSNLLMAEPLSPDHQNTFLPPFPVGLKLDLTCQTTGRKTYWFEKKDQPYELPTHRDEPSAGLHTSVFTIKALNTSDDGRQLMCMKDGSTTRVDVELNVVDKPEKITVNMTEFKGELSCVAFAMNSQLELCWFKDGQEQTCKVPDEDGPSTQTVVNLDVNFGGLMKQEYSSFFTCRPQLVQTDATKSLSSAALMHYQTLLQSTQEELKITVVHDRNCKSNETAVIIIEDENYEGCYKVNIERIKPKPTIPKTTPTTPKTTPTTPKTTPTTPKTTPTTPKVRHTTPKATSNTPTPELPSASDPGKPNSSDVVVLAVAVAVLLVVLLLSMFEIQETACRSR